jgi:gamma-glutamylaminecyclotransferase
MKRFLVFVYGTLKKGFYNHDVIRSENTEFLGRACTLPEYDMVSLGGFPGVVKDGKYKIEGEIYSVDSDTLRLLDHLESNGRLYNREEIELDTQKELVWIYILLDDFYSSQVSINLNEENMSKSWKR